MNNQLIKIALLCCALVVVAPLASGKIERIPAGVDKKVYTLAKQAYVKAKKGNLVKNEYLTIVDYTLPSTQPRMWVINMKTNKVKYHTLVAHGVGSGNVFATKFSNAHGSRMSSLGVFVTEDLYQGKHGLSLNLHGLQKKFNSNARNRRIVVHGAHYVDDRVVNKIGRLGRSFGCLALNPKIAKEVMQTIKNGSVVFCYYPDQAWLSEISHAR